MMGLFDWLGRLFARPKITVAPDSQPFVTSRSLTLDEERARTLLIEATDYKGKDWDRSIACLREAYALMAKSPVVHPTATYCRLPLYLQQAGRFDASLIEFEKLLSGAGPLVDVSFVLDKMQLASEREIRQQQKAQGITAKAPRRKKKEYTGNQGLREQHCKERREAYERTADRRPYIQMLAVGDTRDDPECAALDGLVVHGNSDWAKANWPPHREGCRCTIRTLSDTQLAREGLKLSDRNGDVNT